MPVGDLYRTTNELNLHEVPEPSRAYLVWLWNQYKSSQLELTWMLWCFFPKISQGVFELGARDCRHVPHPKKQQVPTWKSSTSMEIDPWSVEIVTHWARPKESKAQNPNFEPETQRDSKDQVVEVWWYVQTPKENWNWLLNLWGNCMCCSFCKVFFFKTFLRNWVDCRWIYTPRGPQNASFHLLQPPPARHHVVCHLFFLSRLNARLSQAADQHIMAIFSSKHHQVSFRCFDAWCCFSVKKNRMNDLPGAQPGAWWDTNHFLHRSKFPPWVLGHSEFSLWWMSS